MSWEPRDDEPFAEYIVYDEIGAVIGAFGQDERRARECALACGGKGRGIVIFYKVRAA